MKSFQFKLTCWIALGFFSLMLVVLIAFNAYAIHEIAHSAKIRMKTVSRSILDELVAGNAPTDGPIPEHAIQEINAKLSFIDRDDKLAYAIVSRHYAVLYRTPGFNIPLDEEFLARQHKRLFLHEVRSGGDELEDALSEWHFMFRYEGEEFIIFTSDRGDYELIERFANGLAAVLALTIVLAIPAGHLLSRQILRPLNAIDKAVRQVRAGELGARIPVLKSDDELARLIDTLNHTFSDLETSFDRIKEFSADAAHELQTPLTALRGNIEVCLRQERTTEEYQTVLAESVDQVTSMSRLVKDLLLLANPDGASPREHVGLVDFSAVVEDAVAQLEIVSEEADTRVVCEVEPNVQRVGDETVLLRLCCNLIHNAIRFSPAGSTVTVGLRETDDATVLEVRDQGIGISQDDREKIFERFYQVDESRSSGTGLGLSLVKWIVDLHGGSIDVETELGQGSLFRVVLPTQQEQV